jgi:hypothetical protein
MKDAGVWMKGLAAAVIGGALSSAAQALAAGSTNPANLKAAAIAGAALTLSAYLTKSPVGSK